MECKPISFDNFLTHPIKLWETDWLLLTSGDYVSGQFNCMTIGWGSMGVMGGRPFVLVVVRPQRYTYQYVELYPTFTVCAFPRQYRKALNILGTKSGRDGNKISEAGLTLQGSSSIAAPCYKEAELTLECEKIYWNDFDPSHFIDPGIDRNYPKKDYHRCYFGQVLVIRGTGKYDDE